MIKINRKLKVGDRVKVTHPKGFSGVTYLHKWIGTIKRIESFYCWDVLVEFDKEFIAGHDGGGRLNSERGRWGFLEELSLANEDWDD